MLISCHCTQCSIRVCVCVYVYSYMYIYTYHTHLYLHMSSFITMDYKNWWFILPFNKQFLKLKIMYVQVLKFVKYDC